MREEYIIGIDFGHGETAACLIPLEDENGNLIVAEPLQINRSNKESEMSIMSIIYRDMDTGEYSITYKDNSSPIQGFKMEPSKLFEDENIAKKEAFEEFIRQVIKNIVINNSNKLILRENGDCNFKLCIACPTSWNERDIHEYETFFNVALEDLRIRVSWVIRESDAAYFSNRKKENNGCVLLIDYGSSTIDYTAFYNDKRISKDEWSEKSGGASQIEEDLLLAVKEKVSKENNTLLIGDHVQWIRLRCRELKEKGMFAEDEPKKTFFSFVGEEYGIDLLITKTFFDNRDEKSLEQVYFRNYRNYIEKRIKTIKTNIEYEIGEKITKVVLSGGACAMKWVENLVNEIFKDSGAVIKRDPLPQYVVAEGIVKYAKAQHECITEINDVIEEDVNFEEIYKEIWEEEIYKLLDGPIKEVCNTYGESEDNNSIDFFMNSIRDVIERTVEDSNKKGTFNKAVQERLCDDIKVIVSDAIKEKLGKVGDETWNVSMPETDSISIIPIDDSLLEKILDNIQSRFLFIRWQYRNEQKPRDPNERKDIAKKASVSWRSKKGRIELDESKHAEALEGNANTMKEATKKCAKDTFHQYELFKTTFTDASHS